MNEISFGITTYNGSDLLDKCLEALTNSIKHAITNVDSSLLNHQIIIHDDGSSDKNIQKIARKYDAIWFKESINKGLVRGYNVISMLSKHDIICLLDNDVSVPVNFVEELLNARIKHKDYGVLGFVSIKIDKNDFLKLGSIISKHTGDIAEGVRMAIAEPTTQLAGYCYCFFKNDWEAVNGFDERYRMFLADSDFCCMLARKLGKLSLRLNYPKVYHIGHETLYKHKELNWKEQLDKDKNVFYSKWSCSPEEIGFKLIRQCLGW